MQVVSRVNIVLDTIDEEAKNLKTVSAEVRSLPDSDEELKVTISKGYISGIGLYFSNPLSRI